MGHCAYPPSLEPNRQNDARHVATVARWLLTAAWSITWLLVAGCQSQKAIITRMPDDIAKFVSYEPPACTPDASEVAEYEAIVATRDPAAPMNPGEISYWDASLDDILRIALGQCGDYSRPGAVPVAVEFAAGQSRSDFVGVRPGDSRCGWPQRQLGGPKRRLADFDPVLTLNSVWGTNALIQNNTFLSGGLPAGSELDENSAAFLAQVQKTVSTGGVFTLSQTWDYNQNNAPNRLYRSVYLGAVTAAFRQPLWAGSGVDFTSIAGPLARYAGGPINQGIEITRINTRISTLDFENRVQTLLKNAADAWWDLAFAYQAHDSEVQARDSAKRIWDQIKSRVDNGLEGASVADEAQSRANYYERCVLTTDALTVLYQREAQLRRLIGLSVNDGQLIRPAEPLRSGENMPDWQHTLAEALTHRVELRRQKTAIENLTIQLRAARSLANPQVDFISSYNINGFGDNLFNINNRGPYPGAYESLVAANQNGWNLGFQASMPLGFRAARSTIRNLELRVAKAHAVLAGQELEISHELANAYQQADRWLASIKLHEARQEAASERAAAVAADYRAGRTSIDLLVRAEAAVTEATVAYQRSLAEYRKVLTELDFRAGRLLDKYNITLADGVWDVKAYSASLAKNLQRVRARPPRRSSFRQWKHPRPTKRPNFPHSAKTNRVNLPRKMLLAKT